MKVKRALRETVSKVRSKLFDSAEPDEEGWYEDLQPGPEGGASAEEEAADCPTSVVSVGLMAEISSDCRSEIGVTLGLVDAIISVARVLAKRDLSHPDVLEVLKDLRADEDVAYLLGSQD